MIREKCRIRHRIVRYFAPERCVKSLFQKAGILCKGEYSGFPPQSFPTPQNHYHQPLFILEDAAGRIIEEVFAVAADDRQVSQSGKPLCTGASLWAVPKLAMGCLPIGTPANLPVEKLWLILFMKNRMKKGDEGLCENEIIQ